MIYLLINRKSINYYYRLNSGFYKFTLYKAFNRSNQIYGRWVVL